VSVVELSQVSHPELTVPDTVWRELDTRPVDTTGSAFGVPME
jgi:hypothetical protein